MNILDRCAPPKYGHVIRAPQAARYHDEALELGISPYSEAIDHYMLCRHNGCTPRMAAVLALKKFPGVKTDTTFMKGKLTGDASFKTSAEAAWYLAQAEKAGVSTTGKHYYRSMARFPGDPEAWLDSRGDVSRLAEQRGWNVEGAVNYSAPEQAPPPEVDVAPDIVDRETAIALEQCPGERPGDVRERVYNRLSGKDRSPIGRISDVTPDD